VYGRGVAQVADRLSRDDYFAAAMAILAEDGVAGLTTTRLCERLRVTRGSLYHHFDSGPAFHDALIDHWEHELVPGLLAAIDAVEPRARIDLLQHIALHADHDAEKAIRAWAHTNPAVAAALARVDAAREAALAKAFVDVGIDADRAATLARIGFSLLIGAQQLDDPIDLTRLQAVLAEYRAWIDTRRTIP
jgi:AcrR family transcriptional regulator